MTINIEYEAEEKLDLDYEKIITDVVNEAVDYEKCCLLYTSPSPRDCS